MRPIRSDRRPATKFSAPFTKPKATTKAMSSMNEPRAHAELGLGQRRHDGAHHADGEADEQDLQELVQELAEVPRMPWLSSSKLWPRTPPGGHPRPRLAELSGAGPGGLGRRRRNVGDHRSDELVLVLDQGALNSFSKPMVEVGLPHRPRPQTEPE